MRGAKEFSWTEAALQAMGEAGKEIVLTVRGTSMLPMARSADRVSIRLLRADRIKRGEVFAFWEDGCVVVHRCAGRSMRGGTLWLCQSGDNRPGWSWVSQARVIGKVERVMRSGKVLDLSAFPWPWLGSAMGWLAWAHVYDAGREGGFARIIRDRHPGPAIVLPFCRRVAVRMVQAFMLLAVRWFGN